MIDTETNDAVKYPNGRRKRRRERGKDNKPRNYPLHTMKNLPQFREKSQRKLQYILKTRGVDIRSNFNWKNVIMRILIGLVVIASGIGIVKWWQHRQMKNEMENIVATFSTSANFKIQNKGVLF
ncbi:MAG: hypothetical protein OEM77_01125 [Nitrosopumilus sp.]|nr:hypothetical protein [Nitrosopumilus sp.]MDH3735756.1 hypothetical protein [Nitrosopumilus sp.]MDH3822413.1 hypothetical protein [Nitrosopumilus sp.]MDH3833352.1 hypothetical protein [Nitrosopumilus sp.]